MLEAALIARDGGKNLSEWIEVEDEILAKDLDRCARYQLMRYEMEVKRSDARLHSASTAAAFAGQPLEFEGESTDSIPEAP